MILRNISALFLLLSISLNASALDLEKPLPNWIDKTREKADFSPLPAPKTRLDVPADFRIPAEYEPVSAVVISWAGYTSMLKSIAIAASQRGNAQIWAVAGPQSISGVAEGFYQSISAKIDTVWVRDYGPFGLSSTSSKPAIVDTIYRHYQYRRNDDIVPLKIGQAKNIPVYNAQMILDGGNFMIDSKGNLFTTQRTYMWNSNLSKENVDAILKKYFKAKNIYIFEYAGYPGEPQDGTGHIDMFMKLLNDNTVLISVAEDEPFKTNSLKAIEFFKNKLAPNGQPYKIITVKGWYDKSGYYGGTWYTYTNSLIVNNTVIMPAYSGKNQENDDAEKAYSQAGLQVARVYSDESITSGGSIHCVTQTIPKYDMSKQGFTINNPQGEAYDMPFPLNERDQKELPEILGNFTF